MRAQTKYLQRYAEPEARALLEAAALPCWRQVLVIPAYRESPRFLEQLTRWRHTLLILVLNQPESEPDRGCNDALRGRLLTLSEVAQFAEANARLLDLGDSSHVLLIERPQALPSDQGVGLARKLGCDAAAALVALGVVSSRWIHCSDADAVLPDDYFSAAAEASQTPIALTYRYRHIPPADSLEATAIAIYEQHLQHYVDGLRAAGSPYAFHTLGSCIAVDVSTYAKVRGFPRRAAGEDFYLLNKLAKQGSVATPACSPIRLSARLSKRVPFGTGPALRKLLDCARPQDSPLFYDPRCFESLRELIALMTQRGTPGMSLADGAQALGANSALLAAMRALGIEQFLSHAAQHCAGKDAFKRQFHQWFDGFKTLKLIHALSNHWPRLSAAELARYSKPALSSSVDGLAHGPKALS